MNESTSNDKTGLDWALIESMVADIMSNPPEECPWCHNQFYSFQNDDPLKHHMQYCEEMPEEDEEND